MNCRLNETSHFYTAYSSSGKQIFLPKNGETFLPAGSFVREDDDFTVLEQDMILITNTKKDEVFTLHDDRLVLAEKSK